MKQATANSTSTAGIAIAKPTRVLLVEDHLAILELYREGLELAGLEVQTAGDGVEALTLLKNAQPRPEVIVTDIEMPRLDGLELARHATQLFPDIKVIFISGASEHPVTEGHPFFIKPFPIRDLVQCIHDLVRDSKSNA